MRVYQYFFCYPDPKHCIYAWRLENVDKFGKYYQLNFCFRRMSEPSSLEPRMLERRISNNRFVLGYSIINKIILKIFLLGKLTWLNCIYRSLLVLCRKDPLQMDIGYIVDIIIQFCSLQAFFYNYCLVQLNHLNNATASQLTNNLLL